MQSRLFLLNNSRCRAGPGISANDTPLNSIHSSSKCSIGSRQVSRPSHARACRRRSLTRPNSSGASSRNLTIPVSMRSVHTCPGEMSKTFRLAQIAQEVFTQDKATVDFLDLSRLTSEYGRHIHPCKACFSTAPALCHWPCSCYPNYALGQTHDWM